MKISMRGDYQYDAVEKLVKSFKELNAFGHKGATIIFKSPTGSGKTVMMSAVLDELSKSADLMDEFVYIWASLNELHIQSYEKLSTQYLPDSALNMMLLENMGSDDLPANTVLFCNWQSMFRIKKVIDDSGNEVEVYDNKYVRIGETGRNLQEVLAKTRDAGRKIVLIVDEAHTTYMGKNSKKLVADVIQPDMVIEVSATPIMSLGAEDIIEHRGAMVSVKLDDVIAAGMIKNRRLKNITLNEIICASRF